MTLRLTALACAALVALGAPLATASMIPNAGDPVETTGGKLSGTRLPSGVKAYLGVPFARPPVQDLRWRAPQPMRWEGIWNADRKGPECIQVLRPHNINHYFGEEPTGEDCLYLNLWTPAQAKAGDRLPVIVFIYGGGGTIGSSGMANYDGENVARRGAIFVNFNYRVGLLGFMAHPELSREQGGHSGNYGFMDQTAALQWVRDNVARFGGDPDKVVIAGQSFGAMSVAAQIFSPRAKGLFRGAMMSSACTFDDAGLLGAPVPLAQAETVGQQLQARLHVADLAALRQVQADRILAQQAESQLGVSNAGLRAPGVIDGYELTATKAATLAAHAGSDVPVIAGSNGDDIDSNRSPLTRAHTVAEYEAAARRMYGPDADAFLRLYPAHTDAEVAQVAHQAAMEGGFLQNSRTCGDLQARYNHSPVWVDTFVRKHPYAPGYRPADQDPATVGAYHTADVPYWLDTLDHYNDLRPARAWGAADRALTDRMVKALIAFADTGNPSTAQMPWPAWTPARPVYLEIGNETAVRRMDLRRMDLRRMDWQATHPPADPGTPPPRTTPRD